MIKASRGPLGVNWRSRIRLPESAGIPIINVINNKGSAPGSQGGRLHVTVRLPFDFAMLLDVPVAAPEILRTVQHQ